MTLSYTYEHFARTNPGRLSGAVSRACPLKRFVVTADLRRFSQGPYNTEHIINSHYLAPGWHRDPKFQDSISNMPYSDKSEYLYRCIDTNCGRGSTCVLACLQKELLFSYCFCCAGSYLPPCTRPQSFHFRSKDPDLKSSTLARCGSAAVNDRRHQSDNGFQHRRLNVLS
ncbi:hypothetical protein EVAR_15815_1 [Eumeta japonica]|uniref:Uncharacterized protein n=1 Tax=Eumeta variegata TaxID=151549 RepID=A0A4C1TZH4_EUMVA|nr:hypothetical protein EVAR_15815_1 [Eumeta japonica]